MKSFYAVCVCVCVCRAASCGVVYVSRSFSSSFRRRRQVILGMDDERGEEP